jgi:hypothetical protein
VRELRGGQDSEGDHFGKLNISVNGFDVVDAVKCILDTSRTKYFSDEIEKYATTECCVVETGVGTGILSFFAATKTSRVYGIHQVPGGRSQYCSFKRFSVMIQPSQGWSTPWHGPRRSWVREHGSVTT